MKVIRNKLLGYCHGVSETIKNARNIVSQGKKDNVPYYSIGDLIHNQIIVDYFDNQGLKTIKVPEDGPSGLALVRAHGIPEALKKKFIKSGYKLVDSTCINIKKSIRLIKQYSKEGRTIVVLGVKNHAEALCLTGVETGIIKKFLVSDESDLEKLFNEVPENTPVCIITQTTFPEKLFNELTDSLKQHYKDCLVGNRLCQACIQRKKRAIELSEETDAIVVVGDRHSANTKDLAEAVRKSGKPVFEVESSDDFTSDLDEELKKLNTVGLVSGTSTPLFIIDNVASHLESL